MSPHTTRPRRTAIRQYTSSRQSASGFTTAVSLHSHTLHSRELLADLPSYIARIPVVAGLFQRELRAYSRRNGTSADFSKGWWYPPLTAAEVRCSEADQIQRRLGLNPIVSITDHDNIEAGVGLQASYGPAVPLSLEWTVPFEHGVFHLGVHNLPPGSSHDLFKRMCGYSRDRSARRLADLLEDLNGCRETLLVLNHPLWDLARLSKAGHTALLHRFLYQHRRRIHALELNGYRPWRENDAVRVLAEESGLCAISGGDRHGCAPNAVLNLTKASSFGEFVQEIRIDGASEIIVMPAYCERLAARKLAVAADVLRARPGHVRSHWTDRVSCEWRGVERPLSYHWPGGGPLWVRTSVRAFQVLTSSRVMPILRLCLPRDAQAAAGWDVLPETPLAPLADATDSRQRQFRVSA